MTLLNLLESTDMSPVSAAFFIAAAASFFAVAHADWSVRSGSRWK